MEQRSKAKCLGLFGTKLNIRQSPYPLSLYLRYPEHKEYLPD